MSLKLLLTLVVLGCASVFIIGLCCRPSKIKRIKTNEEMECWKWEDGKLLQIGNADYAFGYPPPPEKMLEIKNDCEHGEYISTGDGSAICVKCGECVIYNEEQVKSRLEIVGGDSLKLKK